MYVGTLPLSTTVEKYQQKNWSFSKVLCLKHFDMHLAYHHLYTDINR